MKTLTTFPIWTRARPTQSTSTQGPVSPVNVLSVGSDCGELLLNPAEDGEETEESEWVCRKVERSLFRCSRFLFFFQNRVLFSHSRENKGRHSPQWSLAIDCLSKVIKPNTAAHSQLVGVAIRVWRVDGSSNRLHPFLILFFFFACGHFSAWKKCSRFGKRFVCRAHNYSIYLEWTSAAKTIKTEKMKMDSGHVHAVRQDTDKKKFKKRLLDMSVYLHELGGFFCFVSFNWPDPCCLVTANVTFDWLMWLALCLLSSRQSPVCGDGLCVRLVGRGQLRNDAARSRVAVNSDCTGRAACFSCWNI